MIQKSNHHLNCKDRTSHLETVVGIPSDIDEVVLEAFAASFAFSLLQGAADLSAQARHRCPSSSHHSLHVMQVTSGIASSFVSAL